MVRCTFVAFLPWPPAVFAAICKGFVYFMLLSAEQSDLVGGPRGRGGVPLVKTMQYVFLQGCGVRFGL